MRSTHPKNEEFQTITSEKYNSESLNLLSSILKEILVAFHAYFKKEFGQILWPILDTFSSLACSSSDASLSR